MQEYYKILIVGSSGKGKTYAGRNLQDKSTGLVNIENKPLPFKKNFAHHLRPLRYQDSFNGIVEMGKDPSIDCIFVDSLSAYTDQILLEARKTKKGFDIWSMYNEEVGKFLDITKRVPKHIFVTAHYEILNTEGQAEKRVKVKAKEWEGQIEKEFTVVLYADSRINPANGKPEYWFNTFQEGTSAKCPPDLFGPDVIKIPNDYNFILDKVKEFTKETVLTV